MVEKIMLVTQYCIFFCLTLVINIVFKKYFISKLDRSTTFCFLMNHLIFLDISCAFTLMPVNFYFQTKPIKIDLLCKLHPFLILFIRTYSFQLVTLIAIDHFLSTSLVGQIKYELRINSVMLFNFLICLGLALIGFFSIGINKKGNNFVII